MKKLPFVGLICASLLAVMADQAMGHSVETDYLLSPDNGLALDVNFSTGEPLAEAPVKIYSPDNPEEPWMEGETDENGQFSFLPEDGIEGEWTVEIGEKSHADFLSVPVKDDGIQLEQISQGHADAMVAQSPLTFKTLPAQAASWAEDGVDGVDFDLLLLAGLACGGVWVGRKLLSR